MKSYEKNIYKKKKILNRFFFLFKRTMIEKLCILFTRFIRTHYNYVIYCRIGNFILRLYLYMFTCLYYYTVTVEPNASLYKYCYNAYIQNRQQKIKIFH